MDKIFKNYKFKVWHFVVLVGVIFAVVLVPQILSFIKGIFGSINTAGRSVVSTVSSAVTGTSQGVSGVLGDVGLNGDANTTVATITTSSNTPWSPQYYLSLSNSGDLPDDGDGSDFISAVHNLQGFTGVNYGGYDALFMGMPSKAWFSKLMEYWNNAQGITLVDWMLNGYAFGLISACTKADIAGFDAIIEGLPQTSG
jgi:hypothetical protein